MLVDVPLEQYACDGNLSFRSTDILEPTGSNKFPAHVLEC